MEKIENKDYQLESQNIEIVLDKTICKGDRVTGHDQFGATLLSSWQSLAPPPNTRTKST